MLSVEFIVTSLVVVLIPGTGVIYTISNGLFLGFRFSVAAAIGCTAGIIPHLVACVLGLSAILHMSALAFTLLKYAGAAYLLFLAWSMWRETGVMEFNRPSNRFSLTQVAVKGFLINILNPKLSIFFLAFLPLFVSPQAASPTAQMLLLSAVFMVMTLVIFIIYGLSAHAVRSYVANSPRLLMWLQRSFAAIFAGLGAKLATTDQ